MKVKSLLTRKDVRVLSEVIQQSNKKKFVKDFFVELTKSPPRATYYVNSKKDNNEETKKEP